MGEAMFDLAFALIVGACLGYGLRSFLSHQRRAALKKRLGMD
jgi:hypothetical protein